MTTVAASVTYHPIIKIAKETVATLYDGNYSLFLMRAVKASDPTGAKPTIWRRYSRNRITEQTDPWWHENYTLYSCPEQVPEKDQGVTGYTSYDANLKDQLKITRGNATGSIEPGKAPDGSFTFNNTVADSKFSVGLCTRDTSDLVQPYNAFPLAGKNALTLAPIVKFLVFFGKDPWNEGTVVVSTNTAGALIDFTGSKTTTHVANFTFSAGWSVDPTDEGEWLVPFDAGEVTESLIIPDKKLATATQELLSIEP